MKPLLVPVLLAIALARFAFTASALDADVRELIVGIAPDWNSMNGKLQRFRRAADGSWVPASEAVPVLFGKSGLAWGRGIEGADQLGLHKQEHDGRAPAGVFKIGKIYTYDPALPEGSNYLFHTITDADAWVDDSSSPDYNRFVTIPDAANPPAWFEKQKMRHGDFAYRWLVEIRHNSDPPKPGAGSAIFFHIRRIKNGELRPTSGCTTMAESELVNLIRFLRAEDHPAYALLPWDEYQKKWRLWGLPEPAQVAARP